MNILFAVMKCAVLVVFRINLALLYKTLHSKYVLGIDNHDISFWFGYLIIIKSWLFWGGERDCELQLYRLYIETLKECHSSVRKIPITKWWMNLHQWFSVQYQDRQKHIDVHIGPVDSIYIWIMFLVIANVLFYFHKGRMIYDNMPNSNEKSNS